MPLCPCGFDFDSVEMDEIEPRTRAGVTAIVDEMSAVSPSVAGERPSPSRWSALEYAAHVRDVLLVIRDRIVTGLIEDNPSFTPLYRDERVDLGLYRHDPVDAVLVELGAAATMFIRLAAEIDEDHFVRPVQYGWPQPATRSLAWLAKQAVHETEHHGSDITDNLRRLASP